MPRDAWGCGRQGQLSCPQSRDVNNIYCVRLLLVSVFGKCLPALVLHTNSTVEERYEHCTRPRVVDNNDGQIMCASREPWLQGAGRAGARKTAGEKAQEFNAAMFLFQTSWNRRGPREKAKLASCAPQGETAPPAPPSEAGAC